MKKMAYQTQDVMHAMSVLEPDIKQLHQSDLSSGHTKSKKGCPAVSSMNLNDGGKGGKSLRDINFSEDLVGNDDTIAIIYQHLLLDNTSIWSLVKPSENCEGIAKVYDYRVYAGDT